MSVAGYSQDSQLGLTQAELIILRQEREIVAAQEASRQGQSQSRNERSTMAEPRGRGTGRTSQASSTRGNSAASSSAARRVRLDSTSLSRIQNALENFMRQLTSRIEQLEEATSSAVQQNAMKAATTAAEADAQIKRTKRILQEIDNLETAFDETAVMFDHIKSLRKKTESLGGRFDRLSAQQVSVRPDPRRR